MAYITIVNVPAEVTKLFETVGFTQISGLSPYAWWTNNDVTVHHNYNECPTTLQEVFKLVHRAGYEQGRYDQKEKIKNRFVSLIENQIEEDTLAPKITY